MSIKYDVPGPGDLIGGMSRLGDLLEVLNPLNWPKILGGEKASLFQSVIDMMLKPDTILTSEKYLAYVQYFAAAALVLWAIEAVYRASMMSAGEPGHGKEFLASSFWLFGLVPSLPGLLLFCQMFLLLLGRLVATLFLGENFETGMAQVVSTEGLPPLVAGFISGVQLFLVAVIALELVSTMVLLPIAALLLIIAVGVRWTGKIGDAVFESSVYTTLLSLGTAGVMTIWFAMLIGIANLMFDQNPLARTFAGLAGLIGAALFFWPFNKFFKTTVKPKIRFSNPYGEGRGESNSDGTSSATSDSYTQANIEDAQKTASTTDGQSGDGRGEVDYSSDGIEAALRSLVPALQAAAASQWSAAAAMEEMVDENPDTTSRDEPRTTDRETPQDRPDVVTDRQPREVNTGSQTTASTSDTTTEGRRHASTVPDDSQVD